MIVGHGAGVEAGYSGRTAMVHLDREDRRYGGQAWMPTGPGLNPAQGPAVAMVTRGHGRPMKGFA